MHWCVSPVGLSDCPTVRLVVMAVSSRGLGHGPLKAGTRVRIPLPLSGRQGSFVYRLGRHPFTVQRRVRLPYGLCNSRLTVSQSDSLTGLRVEYNGVGNVRRDARSRRSDSVAAVRHASPDVDEGP